MCVRACVRACACVCACACACVWIGDTGTVGVGARITLVVLAVLLLTLGKYLLFIL